MKNGDAKFQIQKQKIGWLGCIDNMGDGELNKVKNGLSLDYEWIKLIKEAKNLGMTVEEIRLFLSETK